MPRIRREAARLVYRGWSARKVGRYLGFHHTAVMKWFRKAEKIGDTPIPTKSSRPKSHPKQLSDHIVKRITEKRLERNRYAEALHHELLNEGVKVSLSSVKRTLERKFLIKKRSPWKRFHPHMDRPKALKPGDLVQIDTIHIMTGKKTRIYVFVLLDVYSRWVYAKCFKRMSSATSVQFVRESQTHAPFVFKMLQSDHGPEFGRWFVSQIQKRHRYTRIGKPNDNAHIERFNRTLQEECLDKTPKEVNKINCELEKYLRYYNFERVHAGIGYLIPMQMVPRY